MNIKERVLLLCTYFKSSSPSHTKNTLFLFFFSFSLSTKGHRLGFGIRKKNLGYQNPKISLLCPSSSSKSAFETSHFREEKKDKERTPRVPFASSNPKYSLFDGRNSRSSRLVELLSSSSSSFLCPEGGVFGGPFQSRRLRCRRCLSLCRERLAREKKIR